MRNDAASVLKLIENHMETSLDSTQVQQIKSVSEDTCEVTILFPASEEVLWEGMHKRDMENVDRTHVYMVCTGDTIPRVWSKGCCGCNADVGENSERENLLCQECKTFMDCPF